MYEQDQHTGSVRRPPPKRPAGNSLSALSSDLERRIASASTTPRESPGWWGLTLMRSASAEANGSRAFLPALQAPFCWFRMAAKKNPEVPLSGTALLKETC